MNALRTASFRAARAFQFFFALAGVLTLAGLAGIQAAPGGTGEALALRAALRAAQVQSDSATAGAFSNPQRTPAGRTLISRPTRLSGAIRKRLGTTTSSTVPIPGAVQTFDLFNPAPAFRPLIGYGAATAPDNNTSDPPIYLNNLTPLNLTPVWSQDETFIIFSSDRTLGGGIQPDGRFHLWAISVNGGEAFQITTSAGPANGGEFFPALGNGNDQHIAFTSDAQTPGTQNLYVIPFSYSALVGSNNAAGSMIDVADPNVLKSYTNPNNAANESQITGFDQVQRPTFSSTNDVVVFSAHSVTGTYAGHYHLYYLYLNTGGYNSVDTSLPAKLTDGPAEDTDPAYSKDGQFIAFASTATMLANQTYPTNQISSDPNTSQVLTENADPGGLRNLFLISGGGGNGVSSPGFGSIPTQLQGSPNFGRITTLADTDNYGPAWSSVAANQYTNNAPGFEYLAFARGNTPSSPHDIYYLQTVRSINQAGESGKSDEVATTPQPAGTAIYQINAGGGQVGTYQSETYQLNSTGQNLTVVNGGAAGPSATPAATFNLANDPGTPAEIYQTARTGVFTYTLPNLTPNATYTVRLHFADPTSTAAGQRQFNVDVNGARRLQNYDIYQQANSPNLVLGGEVTTPAVAPATTPTPVAGATVTVTNLTTNAVVNTTTTTATPTTGPDGKAQNYSVAIQTGMYSVTVSAPGFDTVTQNVTVNGAAFTRSDASLATNATDGTLSGTVTANGAGIPAMITVNVENANGSTGALVATTPSPLTADPTTGAYTTPLPAGTYYVTATPGTNSGDATQTQVVTITTGATTTANFALASGTNVGTLGGRITDSITNQPIAGGTIRVISGGVVVAILSTSGTATTTGPPPSGDNQPANYSANLPLGTYTLQISAPGYTATVANVNVVNTPMVGQTPANSFVRADRSLTSTGATAGQIPVVVAILTANASANGTITIAFTNSNDNNGKAIGTPIVEGVEVLAASDPTISSGFGGIVPITPASTAVPQNISAIGADGFVTLTFGPPAGFPPVSFNIYRSTVTAGSVTSVNQPGTGSATEGNIPYYTNVPYDPTTNVTTFVDGQTTGTSVTDGTEYFYQVTAVYQEQITPEGQAIATANGNVPNTVIQLNTDDHPTPASLGGNYDDVYPTWSPFSSIFSIAYESGSVHGADPLTGTLTSGVVFGGRTVTYNDPATGFPSETAYSVGGGGAVASTTATGGYSVAASYIGILESQVLNLDPPTLLRFSSDEIVHIQATGTNPVTGTPTKTGINPGQPVTITVRLSDREAGIDDGNSGFGSGGADATKPQVFVQIKNPNSKYQDSQQLEHKVFARDAFYPNQANFPASTDTTSGTVDGLLAMDGQLVGGARDIYPTYGDNGYVIPRGAHGGFYANTGVTIFVGKNGGGTNPNRTIAGTPVPGTNPNLFTAWGPEYECQFLNPQFATGTGQNAPLDASQIDYATPYYLAGVDDQQPFSGENKQRPTTNTAAAGNTPATPAEWLQLSRVPDAQQDHLGGVLYTVTWTTPTSGSDFYLDVIAFDKAVFPNFPPLTSSFSGQRVNWRIYDNVGGFSTNLSIGNNDILVVSDYALGQKFAATTFGGTNGNLNLVPKLYGAEAAVTDVDVNILPDAVYAGYPYDATVGAPNTRFLPAIKAMALPWLNGLGVGSYNDGVIDDGGRVDGSPSVGSQKYSIWRILSRGPLPQSILNSYLPSKQIQPAVKDTQSTSAAYVNVPAATVLDAHRCVLWVSPYTGDLLTDPGTIDDPGAFNRPGAPDRQSTQTILRAFVQGGGRLFVTGQDVGSTLTTGGSVANGVGGFLSDVLNATLASTGGGTFQLRANANRVTNVPTFDGSLNGSNGGLSYPVIVGSVAGGFAIAGQSGMPYLSRLEISGANGADPNFASDASLSQRFSFSPTGSKGANLLGQPDTILPANGAVTAMSYANGAVGMVYHDDPFNAAGTGVLPNGGTGGRTVYAGFGLEALSNDAYSSDGSNSAFLTVIPTVAARNPRANILHNIVGFLRTGFVSGIITQTAGTGAGAGQGVSGVTVYLVSATGEAPPTRATFSAITASDGHFSIIGVEPGTYTLAAYKPGYAHAATNAGVDFIVEGDVSSTASLTITPEAPGNIEGNVHDTGNKPVIGATVSFLSKDKTIVKATTTFDGSNPLQPAGNYFLPTVPVTDYTGSATGPNNPNGNPEYLAAAAPDPTASTTLPGTTYATDVNVLPNTTTGDNSTQGGPPVAFTLTPILPTISGRIYDKTVGNTAAGGAKVSGATIALLDAKGAPVLDAAGNAVATQAGADGTYTLTGIPASQTATTYTISITKAGYSPGSFTQIVYLGDILTGKDVGLTPIPPGSITGTVKDQNALPVAGATVTFTTADGTTVTKTTDAQGNFTLTGVPPGTYSGSAVGPLNPNGRPVSSSSAPQTVVVVTGASAGPVNFVVTTIPPSFAGTVTDSAGNPLPGAAVTVNVANPDGTVGAFVGRVLTAADGTYSTATFAIPPGGTYIVTASLAGYTTARLVNTAKGPTVTTFTEYNGDALTGQNITLTAIGPGTLSGIVTDTANPANPVAGATVTFISTDKTQTYTATTDANGKYSIQSVKSATYNGTAIGPNNAAGNPEYLASASQAVTVTPGAATIANFVLTPILPTVTGKVTDAVSGAALGNVKITFTPTAGGTPVVVTTNASGGYASGPLPAGTYTVTATAPTGYSDSTQTITLALGDTLTLNFPLTQKGTLIGYVTDATTGLPVLGATLTVKDAVTGIAVTTVPSPLVTGAVTTGPDSSPINYLGNLPPGTYLVTATKSNYATQTSAAITITNGPFVRLDLKLVSGVGTLGGLVTDSTDTNPVAGATVTVTDSGGNVVAAFTTAGSTSTPPAPNGDSAPLNYSGQLAQGTYTVTVSKGSRKSASKTVKVVGGQFNRLDFTGSAGGLPPLHTFAAGLNFLSAPYDYSSVPFDTLFGVLNTAPAGTAPNGNRSHVAVWDPTAGSGAGAYAVDPTYPADAFRLGVGYWIFLKNPVSFTAQGATPTTATVPVILHPFWNQIGVPNAKGVAVSSLLFDNGNGGTISFADAVGSKYNIVSPTLYSFDGVGYQPVTAGDTLQPYQAYWIKVNVDATLEIPTQ